MTIGKFLAIGMIVLATSAAASAQTVYTGPGTYQQIGPYTYGPNGSSQQQIDPYTYVTPGNGQPQTTYQQIGPFTYGSNGSTYQQIGPFGYGSNGTTTQTIGNFTYIHTSDGRTAACQQIGSQTYCN